MPLDCRTEKGRYYREQEQRAYRLYEAHTGNRVIETDDAAGLDAVVIDSDCRMLFSVESKARRFDLPTLTQQYGNRWLMSADKVQHGQRVAAALHIPFYGFLWLIPQQTLLVVPICDHEGYLNPVEIERTTTRATCNTKRHVVRRNAYIEMSSYTICIDYRSWALDRLA